MKRKNFIAKRIIAGTMTLAMIVGTVPQMAFAADLTVDDAAAVSVSDYSAANTVEEAELYKITAQEIINSAKENNGDVKYNNIYITRTGGAYIYETSTIAGMADFRGPKGGQFNISLTDNAGNVRSIKKIEIVCGDKTKDYLVGTKKNIYDNTDGKWSFVEDKEVNRNLVQWTSGEDDTPVVSFGKALNLKVATGGNLYAIESITVYPKAIQEIKAEDVKLTYGETGKKIEATAQGALSYEVTEGKDVIEVAKDGAITTKKVGTAKVKITAASTADYSKAEKTITVTVNKANSSVTKAPTANKLTYNGSAQELVEAGTADGGELQYKLDNGEYSKSIPTGIDAGDYTVWYKVVGDENHKDTDAQKIAVTIDKASQSKPDAPTAKEITPTSVELEAIENGEYSKNGYTWQNSPKFEGLDPDTTYTFYQKHAGTENYYESEPSDEAAIMTKAKDEEPGTNPQQKKNITISAEKIEATYGDNNKSIIAEIKDEQGNKVEGLTLSYETVDADSAYVLAVKDDGYLDIKNAGNAKVKITTTGNDEYNGAEYTVDINVKRRTLKATYLDKIQTGANGLPEVTMNDTDLGNPLTEDADYQVAISNNDDKTYKIIITGKGNYDGKVEIPNWKPATQPEDQTLKFEKPELEETYGNAPFKYEVEGAKTSVTYASSNEEVAKVENDGTVTIVGAGEAIITATAEATEKYNEATARYKLKVAKADQEITANSPIIATLGRDTTKPIGAALTKGDGTLSYEIVGNKNVVSIKDNNIKIEGRGKTTIRVTASETKNYKEATKDIVVIVKKNHTPDYPPVNPNPPVNPPHVDPNPTPAPTVHVHTLQKVEYKAPTTETEGNIEYYYCKDCGKYYRDAQALVEIKYEDTILGKLPSIPDVEPEPTIPSEENLSLLLCKGIGGNHQIKLTWLEDKKADGYDIFGTECYTYNFKLIKGDLTNLSYTIKNLKNSKAYKYYVKSYKMVNGEKVYLAKSAMVHVAMTGQKCTNVKTLNVNKSSYTLSAGKTATIKASVKKENSKKKYLNHAAKYRYFTNNKKVASVSKSGEITAKSTGTCKIYVLAENGVYKTVKVTVK